MNKKIITSIVSIILICSLFSLFLIGCKDKGDNDGADPINVKVVVPDGSPAITIAKLLADKPAYDGYNLSYEIVSGAQAIGAKLSNGEANIAIAPTNLGATLYNKTHSIKLVATAVQGALYMVGKQNLVGESTEQKLNSLKGKTVYNIGQAATPGYTFKYILDHYEIPYQENAEESADYVNLKYVQEGSQLIGLFKTNKAEFGILGEPAVTNANNATGTTTQLSIQDVWNEVTSTVGGLPQASVFVKNDLLSKEHADFINWFIAKMEESSTWVKTNTADALVALQEAGSVSLKNLNSEVVERCNIKVVKASQAKSSINTYLSSLYAFDPTTVGNSIPNDDFYHLG